MEEVFRGGWRTCDSSGRMSRTERHSGGTGGLQRIEILCCFLCCWEAVTLVRTSKRLTEAHLIELVSIAREQSVPCN